MYRNESPDDDGKIERFRARFGRSFTEHHERLLDICIGRVKPCVQDLKPLEDGERLGSADLMNLQLMVEVEFAASVAKEMAEPEDYISTSPAEPHAYDVFLMERTMDRSDMRLAVCIPVSKTDDLVWYNGFTNTWELDPPSHKWRVASLSGAARVLEALSCNPYDHPLMQAAMNRSLIFDVADEDGSDNSTSDVRGSFGQFLTAFGRSRHEDSFVCQSIMEQLNVSQRRAVQTVVSPEFDSGFFVIQGPPGCGKTTTLVSMLLAALQQQQQDTKDKRSLLVLAPSNAAVANAALKFWSRVRSLSNFDISWADILVHGENCDPSVRFLNPQHRGDNFSKVCKRLEDAATQPILQEKLRQEFLTWMHAEEHSEDLSMSDLACICPYIDTSTRQGRAYYANAVSQANVIFCTLNSAGSMALQLNAKVSTCMLDEAGQCTEAEFHVATTFPRLERMVVMGDPKQLPSTVIDPSCKAAGYGRSWLENVFKLHPRKVHLLDTQYRMHPQILKFPNRAFYQDRIQSGDNVLMREPYVATPFLFVDTDRKGHEEIEDFSRHNVFEVTVIKSLLFNDQDIVRLLREKEDARVIIISPYKAQVKLLRQHLKLPYRRQLEIATVDSFQGQEGDIVIVSTVRTHRVGFVDDPQRLNVALTRAKRILRVVGDASFFQSLRPPSTLRNLTRFAKRREGGLVKTKISSTPWSRPNWKQTTLWKPTMSQRFVGCLNRMSQRNKNICLNTLFAVARGDSASLCGRVPPKDKPSWYMSCLRGYHDELRIVWVAKMLDKQAIEASFAGTYRECLRFLQMNVVVPTEACIVRPDLSGILSKPVKEGTGTGELVISWPVTNTMQHVLVSGLQLPLGSVQLDNFQEQVARMKPPLIVESRSGTGKTLVLLQHAAYFTDSKDNRPACFVTVSFRLRNELEQRYVAINQAENLGLRDTMFFTFEDLLGDLLQLMRISDFKGQGRCTYLGFEDSKRSHERSIIEPHVVENEIGGVITGSLEAAMQKAPLSREQYLVNLRSNIGYKSDQDRSKRHQVFTEYEKYYEWKRDSNKFDIGDVVLRLLQEEWSQRFSSAYLDEIQDLSYASIYLLCKLAGKDDLRWVCAGDPAQMISPGCSFTFDGLKQTLLAVQNGIESRLSQVAHFLVNYRTSKDILLLANQVLAVARREFPGAIPFARKEVAKKDLGLKVVLCDWNTALKQDVKLGTNQAIVYSSNAPEDLEATLTNWVGNHPFIVSSIQSKGLEFDDVIVVFDHDRKTWNVAGKREASLRMLRELYVAVTRAQQRVVILVKKAVPEMRRFYEELECEFLVEGAELVLRDFHTVSSSDDWLKRANDFFNNKEFQMAARCYDIAGDQGWCHWASGKYWEAKGADVQAADQYLIALEKFAERKEYELVLDISVALAAPSIASKVGWDKSKDGAIEEAIARRPDHLKKFDLVRLSLLRDAWDNISTEELKDSSLANLFVVYRKHPPLKRIILDASAIDRKAIESVLPLVVGDFYLDRLAYAEAVRVFLSCNSVPEATNATHVAVRDARAGKRQEELPRVVECWTGSSKESSDPVVSHLIGLFQSPLRAAETHGKDCLHYVGCPVVIFAVDTILQDRTFLHEFSQDAFRLQVTEALATRYKEDHVNVVRWFLEKEDVESALAFVHKRLRQWTDHEFLRVVEIVGTRPKWLFDEIGRRRLVAKSVLVVLGSSQLQPSDMFAFIKSLSANCHEFQLDEEEQGHLYVSIAWALNEAASEIAGKKKNQSKASKKKGKNANHSEVLSSSLLTLWPEESETSNKADAEGKFVVSESLCKNLLVLAYGTCNGKKALVQSLGENKMATKACTEILGLAFNQKMSSTAIEVTRTAFRSKDLGVKQLWDILSTWSHLACIEDALAIMSQVLESKKTTMKQRKGIINLMPKVVHFSLSRDGGDIGTTFSTTCSVARLKLTDATGIFNILTSWDKWASDEAGEGGMFPTAEAVVSFLLILVANKSDVGLLEHDDEDDHSLLLSSYGGSIFTWTRRLMSLKRHEEVLNEAFFVSAIDHQKKFDTMIRLKGASIDRRVIKNDAQSIKKHKRAGERRPPAARNQNDGSAMIGSTGKPFDKQVNKDNTKRRNGPITNQDILAVAGESSRPDDTLQLVSSKAASTNPSSNLKQMPQLTSTPDNVDFLTLQEKKAPQPQTTTNSKKKRKNNKKKRRGKK